MKGAIQWYQNLGGGINQAVAPDLIPDSQVRLALNVSFDEIGAISHRKGTELFCDTISDTVGVRGLHMYEKRDGNNYFHTVMNRTLRVANEGTEAWDSQISNAVAADCTQVEFTNFLNRHYYVGNGTGDTLRWVTESGTATAVTGDLSGDYLATNDAYMVLIDQSAAIGYWSNLASDTFNTEVDFINITRKPTGIAAFGNGRPFVIFSESSYIYLDPALIYTNEVEGIGCVSHKSIANVRGTLIFLDREGFYKLGSTDSAPIEISRLIRNDAKSDGIFDKITATNFEVTAAGAFEDKYYCCLRDLSGTIQGTTINDCVVVIDLSNYSWKVYSMTTGGVGKVFAKFTRNDTKQPALYGASIDSNSVYKIEVDGVYTDENSGGSTAAVTAIINTKHHPVFISDFGEVSMKTVYRLHFKYRATSAITVRFALDGNQTFTAAPASLPATTAGLDYEYAYIDFGEECRTISLQFETTGDFAIYKYGFEGESNGETGTIGQ